MAENNARKINFLKKVEPEYLDHKKLDLIDSIKIKTNEYDERILDKTKENIRGVLQDVTPVVS